MGGGLVPVRTKRSKMQTPEAARRRSSIATTPLLVSVRRSAAVFRKLRWLLGGAWGGVVLCLGVEFLMLLGCCGFVQDFYTQNRQPVESRQARWGVCVRGNIKILNICCTVMLCLGDRI